MPSLKARAQFYRTLQALEGAGVPAIRALESAHPHPFNTLSSAMAAAIRSEGLGLAEAFERYPGVFSATECAFIRIGAGTGRLETVYTSLAEWFELCHSLRRSLISRLVYPAFVLHIGAALVGLLSIVLKDAGVGRALLQVLAIYALFWVPVILLTNPVVFRAASQSVLGRPIATILSAIPVLGKALQGLDLARFLRLLAMAMEAGLSTPEALKRAADTMWNPCFRDRLHTTAARLEQEGGSLVDTLVEERAIAPGSTVCAILRTGEETGRVPDMAARAGTNMWEEVNQTFQQLAVLAAWAVYIAIIVYLAIQIVTAWSGLLSRTMQLTEF